MRRSIEPTEPIVFRTASAPSCPSDARLILGSLDDALARQIRRARTIGFRLAVLALAGLGAASVALLLEV